MAWADMANCLAASAFPTSADPNWPNIAPWLGPLPILPFLWRRFPASRHSNDSRVARLKASLTYGPNESYLVSSSRSPNAARIGEFLTLGLRSSEVACSARLLTTISMGSKVSVRRRQEASHGPRQFGSGDVDVSVTKQVTKLVDENYYQLEGLSGWIDDGSIDG
jgi:hypothetical protein